MKRDDIARRWCRVEEWLGTQDARTVRHDHLHQYGVATCGCQAREAEASHEMSGAQELGE
jgi:hypothetical protein